MKNNNILEQITKLHFFCLLFFVLGVSVIFVSSDLDLLIATYFYNFKTASWRLAQNFWVNAIYNYGALPQLLSLHFLWVLLFLAYFKKTLINYNKHLILVSAVFASEILVVVCKELFSRPRPRELIVFGGDNAFAKLWQIGEQGLSFPSSHAKSGFIMIVLFYLLYFSHKKIAYFFLVLSLLLGAALGYARIAQGGHFLSDVIFSGFFAHFSVLASVYFLDKRKIYFNSFVKKLLFLVFSLLLFFGDWNLFLRFYLDSS